LNLSYQVAAGSSPAHDAPGISYVALLTAQRGFVAAEAPPERQPAHDRRRDGRSPAALRLPMPFARLPMYMRISAGLHGFTSR
jgi:hypothetical protein